MDIYRKKDKKHIIYKGAISIQMQNPVLFHSIVIQNLLMQCWPHLELTIVFVCLS